MGTKKQDELLSSYLSQLNEFNKPLFKELADCLAEFGYSPAKQNSSISFKHSKHNKQIAKMGTRISKKDGPSPSFSLRFSACSGYSQRFADIVANYAAKYPTRPAGCPDGKCGFCAGDPQTHVYKYASASGERLTHCGAYAIEIPGVSADDLPEIKKLIREEYEYLMKHEAGL